jgi:hypothetical protein
LLQLMRDVRANLAAGRFSTFKDEFLAGYPIIPHQVRAANREKRRSRVEGSRSQHSR